MKHEMNIAGLPVFIEGNGDETIVMLHGWPDTHRIWSRQIASFKQHYRCVSFSLPGFGDSRQPQGYSLAQVVETIRQIVDAVSPDKKIILMVHDWGCIFGYQFAMLYPQRIARMIAVDLGDTNSPELEKSLSLAAKSMILAYQTTLAASWYIGGYIGDMITRGMSKALQGKADPQHIHCDMNYPYAIRWMRTLGSFDDLKQVNPEFPFFYAYGRKKPFMFHSPAWLARMANRPGNIVREFNSGHWVMVDCADEFNTAVSHWLTTLNAEQMTKA